jgi:ABC-type Na+ efflux pump permease subunit
MTYPDSGLTQFFSYFPWTSGMVSMVKVTVGVSLSQYLMILISWVIQLLVGTLFISLAARIFKHGILSFGHRWSMKLWFSWLKK